MADWLGPDHLVWFLIDAVEAMDTSVFHSRQARAKFRQGRAGFDPDMLVTLLLYGYAHGVRSSRQIERLCSTDVAFRVICAQDVPDHSTVARFRSEHEAAFTELFTQVLVLCAKAGLGRVGSIAVDGTKIAANASIDANRTEDKLRAGLEAALAAEAERIVAAAAAADVAEDALFGDKRGDELPPSMRGRGGGRVERLRECLAQIGTEAAERTAERAVADAKATATVEAARDRVRRAEVKAQAAVDDYQHRWAQAGQRPGGRPPQAVDESGTVRRSRERLAKAERRHAEREARLAAAEQATVKKQQDAPRRNVTDPDSRIMPTRKGWIQGYNAQLAVTDDHLILAVALTQDTVDTGQAEPMTTAALDAAAIVQAHRQPTCPTEPETGPETEADVKARHYHGIKLMLFDAGYFSEDNLTATGPDRLIALGRARDLARAQATDPASGPPPDNTTAIEQMSHRLRTPEGHQAYKRRAATVEPVNGHLKDQTGLRRFSRRGITAALSELNLAAAVVNLLKLHTRTLQPAT